MEYVDGFGVEEIGTIDEDGFRNSWLTIYWKEFISLPFVNVNSILQFTF